MGLADLLSSILGSGEASKQSEKTRGEGQVAVDLPDIEYKGDRFHCEHEESENGEWTVAHGRSFDSDEHRVFVFNNQDLRFTKGLTRTEKSKIANNGRTVVVDGGDREELSGKLRVFEASGKDMLSWSFDSNIGACAVSNQGDYAAVASLNPDCTTYVFNLDDGEPVLEHENLEGNKMGLEFKNEEEGPRLYLSNDDVSNPLYAINLGGDIVWRSEELQRQQQLQELMDSSETADLEEALDLLEEGYEIAEDENEKKNVAKKMADTHWNLAKEINREKNDSDEWWMHLNQAKARYTEILPWYDGKQGVAKVSRKQGKYYLDQGEEEAALEIFQNIADLEEEYDVQLLTDADERKIEELS